MITTVEISREEARRVAGRRALLFVAQALFNVGVFASVLLWGVPWFGPLLIPATILFFVSIAFAYPAATEALNARQRHIEIGPGPRFEIDGTTREADDIRLERRPGVWIVRPRLPRDYYRLGFLQKLRAGAALHTLYLDAESDEAIADAVEGRGFEVIDQRTLEKGIIPFIYGLTVLVLAGLLAWRALLWLGVVGVMKGSEQVDSALGLPTATVFLVFAAVAFVLLMRRLLSR